MRDDVFMTRHTGSEDRVARPSTVSGWSTSYEAEYRAKLTPGLAHSPVVAHKNLSQIPGFDGPPNSHAMFATSSGTAFVAPPSPSNMKAAGTPRHHAKFKEKGEAFAQGLFGDLAPKGAPTQSTTQGMLSQGASGTYTRKPRFVNGGAFRNASTVPLDKNDPAPSFNDYASTAGTHFTWRPGSPRATHRYELPQKNASTAFASSMGPRLAGPAGNRPQPVPPGFFTNMHRQHFTEYPGVPLVVPPGKGGVDMTGSVVPLGSDFHSTPTPEPHSHYAYTGAQLDEIRHTCASRGTLGARGGRKLPRDSSGAPAGFSNKVRSEYATTRNR